VEITLDDNEPIIVYDVYYNEIMEKSFTGRLQASVTIYSTKGVRLIGIPLSMSDTEVKQYFDRFKICAKITRDDSNPRIQQEQRFLMIMYRRTGIAYWGGLVPLDANVPLGQYALAVPLSAGEGCLIVDTSKLPKRNEKLYIGLTWDTPDEEDLPKHVVFTVWLEDNVVEIPETSTSTTWHLPSGEIPEDDRKISEDSALLYAAAGLALALLVLTRPRR